MGATGRLKNFKKQNSHPPTPTHPHTHTLLLRRGGGASYYRCIPRLFQMRGVLFPHSYRVLFPQTAVLRARRALPLPFRLPGDDRPTDSGEVMQVDTIAAAR